MSLLNWWRNYDSTNGKEGSKMQSCWNSKGNRFEFIGIQGNLKLKYNRKEELLNA